VCKDNIAAYVSITLPHLRRQRLTAVCGAASGLKFNSNIDVYIRARRPFTLFWVFD